MQRLAPSCRSPHVASQRRSLCGSARLTPQLLAGKPRALGERFELRPHDRGMDATMERALREAAIGPGNDVLAADQLGEPHDPLGNEGRMLDDIGRVADDTWNEHLAR